MDVPEIDIGPLYRADDAARAATLAAMHRAAREVGFFHVANSHLAPALVARVQDQAARFHALPDGPAKRRLHSSRSPQRRGWTAAGEEPAYEPGTVATCEAFDLARELPPEPVRAAAGNLGPNLWPAGLPGFREEVYGYYLEATRLGRVLFRAFAEMLGLEPERFARLATERAPSTMRLLRYPPAPAGGPDGLVGISAHSDFECFTILHQSAPGLELLTADGRWLEAPVLEGRFLILIGDMLERWSNGYLKATRHRVRATAVERHSIVLFCAVDGEVEVAPLPEFVSPGNPPRYPPVTQQQHLSREVSEALTNLAGGGR